MQEKTQNVNYTIDTKKIKEMFDWNDAVSYKWVLKSPGNTKLTAIFKLILFILIPTIIYLILYLISLLSLKLAFYIAFVLFIIWFAYIAISLFSIFTGNQAMKDKSRAYMRSQTFVFIALLAYVISSPVSFFAQGFSTVPSIATISVLEWIKYFLDNTISVISIGIFDIFDINLSNITPISKGAKAMMFLFNIVLAIGIVEAFIDTYRKRKDEEFFGTVKEFYYRCDNLPIATKFKARLEGAYTKYQDLISFDADNFKTVFIDEANPDS